MNQKKEKEKRAVVKKGPTAKTVTLRGRDSKYK